MSHPIPGLAAGIERSGRWLFRWRSYPPLAVLALAVGMTAMEPRPFGGLGSMALWYGFGLGLGALGLAVRAWAIGTVPFGTSGGGTRAMRADTLNTEGPYSIVRHPLYLGNLFLWLGVAAFTGKPTLILVTCLLFWLYYERIICAEERFLSERFGNGYASWAERTPAFWPRVRSPVPSSAPFRLRAWLGRDYGAVYAFVVSTWIVVLTRSVAGFGQWMPNRAWGIYLGAGTGVFLILRLLKKRTALFRPTPAASRASCEASPSQDPPLWPTD